MVIVANTAKITPDKIAVCFSLQIGYDKSKDFSNDWWTAAFNRSAKKLIVTTGEVGNI